RQAQQVAIAAPMLRAMLEDRCKLVVHTVPTHIQGYALVLSKRPLKLKQAQADEPRPAQGPYGIMEGGWMITYPKPGADVTPFTGFRKVTMAQFTDFVSMGQAPIVDQTGLQGIRLRPAPHRYHSSSCRGWRSRGCAAPSRRCSSLRLAVCRTRTEAHSGPSGGHRHRPHRAPRSELTATFNLVHFKRHDFSIKAFLRARRSTFPGSRSPPPLQSTAPPMDPRLALPRALRAL